MNNDIIISNKGFREKKKPLYVFLSKGLDDRFRKFIALKYQRMEKGLISHEVEEAIRNHLAIQDTQQSTQALIARPSQIFGANQLMEQIKVYLIESELYVDIPDLIPEVHLNRSIASLRGSDMRTIRKWKKLLIEYGQIKRTGIKQYQIKDKLG